MGHVMTDFWAIYLVILYIFSYILVYTSSHRMPREPLKLLATGQRENRKKLAI